jgi:hypothetical protein
MQTYTLVPPTIYTFGFGYALGTCFSLCVGGGGRERVKGKGGRKRGERKKERGRRGREEKREGWRGGRSMDTNSVRG